MKLSLQVLPRMIQTRKIGRRKIDQNIEYILLFCDAVYYVKFIPTDCNFVIYYGIIFIVFIVVWGAFYDYK